MKLWSSKKHTYIKSIYNDIICVLFVLILWDLKGFTKKICLMKCFNL